MLNDQLADDYDLGREIRKLGYTGEVAATTVVHDCAEETLAELWRHKARWARTIRMIDPAGFLGQGFTYATAYALLGCIPHRFAPGRATAALLAVVASRLYVVRCVDGATGARARGLWLLPLRDLFSFAVFVSALFGKTVIWGGRRYVVDQAGALSPAREVPYASHPVPAGALLRRLRRRGRIALPGQARDQVFLVSDLAGPAAAWSRTAG